MKLQHFSVRRPVTLSMCVVAVIIFGILSFNRLSLDLLPDLQYPTLAVVTVYPNADPESVELQVTRPVESALSTVTGLKRLESNSMENASVILAHFDWGTDLGSAFEEINALLSIVSALLPADVQSPLVAKLDPSQLPIIQVGITGAEDAAQLTAQVEQYVRPILERVPGVAQVSVLGGSYPQYTLYYNTDAVRNAMLTPLDLVQMIQAQNVTVPAGAFYVGPDDLEQAQHTTATRYNVRVGNTFTSAEDLENLVISLPRENPGDDSFGLSSWLPPPPVKLADVATLVREDITAEGFTRIDGTPALIIRVLKQSDANSVAVSQGVRSALDDLTASGIGLDFSVITDQADLITDSLDNLRSSAVVGGILALLILLVFLRSWRELIVIGISIPLSLVIALILMQMSNLTLNLMTLGGMAITVGMLVDNAIVVLENIHRLRSQGMSPQQAAQQGTAEVASAISASTLTTIAVFVPLLFVQSLAGYMFRELAIVVTFALLGSLAVALTVVPMLSAHLPIGRKPAAVAAGDKGGRAASKGKMPLLSRLGDRYIQLLRHTMKRPFIIGSLTVLLVAALAFLPGRLDTAFLPAMDGGLITMHLTLPAGTPVDRTDAVVASIESQLARVPEIDFVSVQVGNQGASDFLSLIQDTSVSEANLAIILKPLSQRRRSAAEISSHLRATLDLPSDATVRISADRAGDSLGEDYEFALALEILGDDWERMEEISATIARRLRQTPGFTDVVASAEQLTPELYFEVDRVQSARALLTAAHVGITMRAALTGLDVTTLQDGGAAIPVRIRPERTDTADLASLGDYRVFNMQRDGENIPQATRFSLLTSNSSPQIQSSTRTIQHIDRQRVLRIKSQLDGIDLGAARQVAEEIIADLDLPLGYEVRLAGIHATLDESLSELWFALLLAIVFVYMVMAAQFESLRFPLVVMVTVPLAAVGTFIALFVAGQQLNVPAFMGLITLTGISVNNGIVLVDAINQLRRRGQSVDDAVINASLMRLRPILMTALTTVLGLIPLALGWGEGTEIQVPLAIATIGGLLSATALTLIFVPALYRLIAGSALKPDTNKQQLTTGA